MININVMLWDNLLDYKQKFVWCGMRATRGEDGIAWENDQARRMARTTQTACHIDVDEGHTWLKDHAQRDCVIQPRVGTTLGRVRHMRQP